MRQELTTNTTATHVLSFSPTVLTVPGLNGSPYEHWQSVWERERDDCKRVDLVSWHEPRPDEWVKRLDLAVAETFGPVVIAAHSLGCLTTALWLRDTDIAREKVLGVLMVAPCDPYCGRNSAKLGRFAHIPRWSLPVRSIVIASADDPYATIDWSRQLAGDWGAEFINLGKAGHINAESGLGSWTYGQIMTSVLMAPAACADQHATVMRG